MTVNKVVVNIVGVFKEFFPKITRSSQVNKANFVSELLNTTHLVETPVIAIKILKKAKIIVIEHLVGNSFVVSFFQIRDSWMEIMSE